MPEAQMETIVCSSKQWQTNKEYNNLRSFSGHNNVVMVRLFEKLSNFCHRKSVETIWTSTCTVVFAFRQEEEAN